MSQPPSQLSAISKNMSPSMPQRAQKIEAITTSVGYADMLAHTLPRNLHHFDSMLVVTAPEDKATQKVCDHYRVPYFATDAFRTRWGQFCKGSAINEALARLKKDAWICHIDSDVALAPNARESLEIAQLPTDSIFGIDRLECKSYEDWLRFVDAPEPVISGNDFMIHTAHSPFPLGTRVQMMHHGGYIPIGFFQLWHADSGNLKYPEGHTDAGREDSHFAAQWPRGKRALIPEILCYHLESEPAVMGANWKGRTTQPFSMDGTRGARK
jgi:hypothetical protein